MDNRSRIAMIRIGNSFGDSTPDVQYNLEDNLGSSVMHLKDDGATLNKEEYYPFGETSFGSYAEKHYKYCAKERDKESGLYYYGARYYSPWICKFVSVDPLARDYPFYGPYDYAGNKPINDIDGMQTQTEAESVKLNTPSSEEINSNPNIVVPNVHWKTEIGADNTEIQILEQLGISVPMKGGSIIGKSPTNWVWHHSVEPGIMQLVPKAQHTHIPGGIFWEAMHPGGAGGMSLWGGGYK